MGGFAAGIPALLNGAGAAPAAAAAPVAAAAPASSSLLQQFGQKLGMPMTDDRNSQMQKAFQQMAQPQQHAPMQMPQAQSGGAGQAGNALGSYLTALMNKGGG